MDDTNFDKIWDTLYVLVTCFKPSTYQDCQAMYTFFEGLKFILPDSSMRYLLLNFMANTPLEIVPCNTHYRIAWVSALNQYMCRNMRKTPKLDFNEICKTYDPKKITKKRWGNSVWYFIHYTAINQPRNLTYNIAISFKHMMEALTVLLPCQMCRGHLKQHLQDFPIDNYLGTNESLFEWTFQLHNKVNISLKKPVMYYSAARELYVNK